MFDWIGLIKLFLGFGTATASAVEAHTLPEEIQISKHRAQLERKSADEIKKMLRDDFRTIVMKTGQDIDNYVDVVHHAMPLRQRFKYTQALKERVYQYRYAHPYVFRKWIRSNPK